MDMSFSSTVFLLCVAAPPRGGGLGFLCQNQTEKY